MGRGDPGRGSSRQNPNLGILGTGGKLGASLHAFGHGRSLCVKQEGLARRLRGTGDHRLDDRHHFLFLCKLCLALLLIGHAGFGFAVQKQMLIDHWQSIGVKADATFISQIGYAELGLGILIFLAPVRPLVFLALGWKLFTEFLYVPADTVTGMGIVNIFEWIERWGDYGIPLVMLYILSYRAKREA